MSAKGMSTKPHAIWAQDADLEEDIRHHEEKVRGARGWALIALAFQTCGIVYGDIGTSPLYTFAAVFPDGAPDDENRILGAFAMIFWAITAVVMVKYIFIVLRADDNGEGGTFALYSLLCRAANLRVHATDLGLSKMTEGMQGPPGPKRRLAAKVKALLETRPGMQVALLVVVMVSACMVLSDGILTPSISVISAIEGLQYNTGISKGAVLGITCAILIVLFMVQFKGTESVSFMFSPIIVTWLLANLCIGFYNIFRYRPDVFKGLSPSYIYYFWSGQSTWAWKSLGHVMLAITGTEALYADMGHFSRPAIRLSFVPLVYPSLAITYLGQTAFVLEQPEMSGSAFWASQPHALKWPMVVLATCAAIIASQALITGSFSVVQQAVAMNCFPRLSVKHTSKHSHGQVFIPVINYFLMVCCVVVVLVFGSSTNIGNAYGLAVNSVEIMTTSLVSLLALIGWQWHPAAVGCFWLVFTTIEGAFLSSNLTKVPKGAWFSLAVATILTCITYTWHWGQELKLRYIQQHAVPLRRLLTHDASGDDVGEGKGFGLSESGDPVLRLAGGGPVVARVPGVGLYYNELLTDVPPVLVRFLHHMPALHKVVIFLTLRSVPLPHVAPRERLLVRKLRLQGFFHAVVRYGYLDSVSHSQEFVKSIEQEILEYLSPGMGFEEMSVNLEGSFHGSTYNSYAWAPSAHAPALYPTVAGTEAGSVAGTFHSFQGAAMAAALRDIEAGGTIHSIDGRELAANLRAGRVSARLAMQRISPAPHRAITFTAFNYDGAPTDTGADLPWVQQPSAYRRLRNLALHGHGSAPPGIGGLADQHLYGAMTMPLPPAPPRPALHSLHGDKRLGQAGGGEDGVGGAMTLPLPPAPPRAPVARASFLARSSAEAAVQRSAPEPTIPEEAPTHPERSQRGTAAQELPPGSESAPRSEPPTPTASTTAGSTAKHRMRPRLPSWWARKPGGPAPPSPDNSLSPVELKTLARDLAARLKEGRRPEQEDEEEGEQEEGQKGQRGEAGPERESSAATRAGSTEPSTPRGSLRTSTTATARTSTHELPTPATARAAGAGAGAATEELPAGGALQSGEGSLDPPASTGAAAAAAASLRRRRQVFHLQSVGAQSTGGSVGSGTPQRGGAEVEKSLEEEREFVEESFREGPVAYLLGRSQLRAADRSAWFKVLVLEGFYAFLVDNAHSAPASYGIPPEDKLELGVTYEV